MKRYKINGNFTLFIEILAAVKYLILFESKTVITNRFFGTNIILIIYFK